MSKKNKHLDTNLKTPAQCDAQRRAEERALRSPQEQLSVLDHKLGVGVGAERERARLARLISPVQAQHVSTRADTSSPSTSVNAPHTASEKIAKQIQHAQAKVLTRTEFRKQKKAQADAVQASVLPASK